MKLALKETQTRGTLLFPFQHYKMTDSTGSLFVSYHWHDEIEIIYQITGTLLLSVDGQDYTLKPGDIYFINREELHQFSSADPTVYYYAYVFPVESLDFRTEDYSQTVYLDPLDLKKLCFPRALPKTAVGCADISREVQKLIAINESAQNGFQLRTKACLYNIIAALYEEGLMCETPLPLQDGNVPRSDNLRQIMIYLQEHYAEKLYLSDIAQTFHLSPKYFSRYFRQNFGRTFIEYLTGMRMDRACILLTSTALPIMEISQQSGFENFSYFIKQFKKHTGKTPSEYRKRPSLN